MARRLLAGVVTSVLLVFYPPGSVVAAGALVALAGVLVHELQAERRGVEWGGK